MGNGPVAQPVAFNVAQEDAHPVARRGVRPVLTDDLLHACARLCGKPLAPGEGGHALDQRTGAVEVEAMHALPPGPVEVRLPVAPEPAIGRPRKVHGRLAPGGLHGRGPDRSGAGIRARLRGGPVGRGGLRGGCGLPCGFRRPLGVPTRLLALRLGVLARLLALQFGFLPRCVRRPGRGGAQVAAGPGMHLAQLLQLAVADAGAFREKPLEYPGTGREGRGLLHQRAVAVQGVAEDGAERHRLALVPDARAEVVPGGHDLAALGREGVDGSAVAPAGGRMADVARDPSERVVVRGGVGVGRAGLGRAGLPHAVRAGPAVRLPGIAPRTVRDVVERRLLGLGPRPALRQIPTDVRVRHRHVGLVFGRRSARSKAMGERLT